MKHKAIFGKKIITPFKVINNGFVIINNNLIEYVGTRKTNEFHFDEIDYEGEYVVPGFIDIHCHGGNGYDTMDSTETALKEISIFKGKNGCTGFLPTTVTSSIKDKLRAVEVIKKYKKRHTNEGAEILGIHLEGPFINPRQKGAQREDLIIPISLDTMENFINESGGLIKIVTYAPELDENFKFTSFLKLNNIIPSVGHSFAEYETIINAIKHGLQSASHTFNQMKGTHHRQPGTVGAVLAEECLFAEIIADCIHVHPAIIKLLVKAKGANRVILVTDAIRAAGLNDGTYDLGGQSVIVKNGEARLKSGNLAGSTLTMNKAIKNMVQKVGIDIKDCIKMASLNPATLLGLDKDRGSLLPGKRADITILDKNFNIIYTIREGRLIYNRGHENIIRKFL